MMATAKDGIIGPDSVLGKWLGFTSDKFDGYLWKQGRRIYISFIISKIENKGNFSKLVKEIISHGFDVAIPPPMGKMELIVRKWKFKKIYEFFPEANCDCEVWVMKNVCSKCEKACDIKGGK